MMHIYEYFVDSGPLMALVGGSSHFLFSVLFWLVHRWRPQRAPMLVYLYLAFWLVKTNLSFRDAVPDALYRRDKTRDETSILEVTIITHFVNKTSFATTALVFLPMVLFSFYMQLIVQVELYHDPYSLELREFTGEVRDTWVYNKFSDIATIVIFLVCKHYYA